MKIDKAKIKSFAEQHGEPIIYGTSSLVVMYAFPMFSPLVAWLTFRQIRKYYEGVKDDRNNKDAA